VRPVDNVPVLSWLWLRGRCRGCGAPISVRYPLVEAATGALWVLAVAAGWGDAREIALGLVLVTALVPITLIDLEHRRIPNAITGPAAVAALAATLLLDPGFLVEALVAGALAFAFFLVPALLRPGGMGMGDVKLAGLLGLCLGRAAAPAVLIALVGGAIMARRGVGEGRRTAVPFGPFLALGGIVALVFGTGLVDLYLGDA
jgi:leader peptidase (prepilin peptidase)/N-methyltransferase